MNDYFMNDNDFYWINENRDFYELREGKKILLHNAGNVEELMFQYAENYIAAACRLTDYVVGKHDISKLDVYFFPIAFLYRHSIELCLKASLFKNIVDDEERIQVMKDTKHNLRDIFSELEVKVGQNFKVQAAHIAWMKEFLSNINEVDKESDSFRYPFAITSEECLGRRVYGLKTLFNKQTHINLVKFSNKMLFAYRISKAIYLDVEMELAEFNNLNTSIFEEGGNYYQQSVVGYEFSRKKFYPFVKSYMDTPTILFEYIMESTDEKNELFMPMCYLFRNAIELLIKQIMFEESSYGFQEALNKMNKKKHKVVSLWNLIVDDIKEHASVDEHDNTFEIVFKYIHKLNEIDVKADIFRYPINNVLEVYFQQQRNLDITNVLYFFMELLTFLDSVSAMMSAQNELKAEIEQELYDYYTEDYY